MITLIMRTVLIRNIRYNYIEQSDNENNSYDDAVNKDENNNNNSKRSKNKPNIYDIMVTVIIMLIQ